LQRARTAKIHCINIQLDEYGALSRALWRILGCGAV